MIVHKHAQGTLAWFAARAGVITASMFHLTRAAAKLKTGPNKGEYNEKAKNYAFRLAVERIAQAPIAGDDWVGWQADRGIALEPEARKQHELRHDVLVETVGFCTTDDGKFGASFDGKIIGRKAGAEYKCFLAPDKIQRITLTGDTADVIDQCDGGMWLSACDEWHFGLYCPAMAPIGLDFQLFVINRDDDRIFELERDLLSFDKLVTEYEGALRLRAAKGIELPAAAPWAGADELAAARPAAEPEPKFGHFYIDKPAPVRAIRQPLPENLF